MKSLNTLLNRKLLLHILRRTNHVEYDCPIDYIPVVITRIGLYSSIFSGKTVMQVQVGTLSDKEQIKIDRKRTGISIGLLNEIIKFKYMIILEDINKKLFLKEYNIKYSGGFSSFSSFYFNFNYTLDMNDILIRDDFGNNEQNQDNKKNNRFENLDID